MVYIKDGKKYYTIEESKNILDKYIMKSADELILELRKRRENRHKVESKEGIYA